MSHPPETSLTSRELVEALSRLSPVNPGLKWLDDAKAFIDAWVQREHDTAHAAAIQMAVDTAYNVIRHGREHSLEGDEICADLMDALKELAPADAQRLFEFRVAEARLDELTWATGAELQPQDNAVIQKRITELSAKVERLK